MLSEVPAVAKTFLQLVNYVLTSLREDTVLGFTESYAAMIAQMVNDAKEDVEDSGPWRALRTAVSVAATSGNATTTLTSTNPRSYIMYGGDLQAQFFRTDAGHEAQITVVGIEVLRQYQNSAAADNSQPSFVAFTTDGTNLVCHFWPTPDATYNYRGIFVIPQAELSATTDTLTIPWRPVARQAVFYAMDERGSEFSGRLETEAAKAKSALDGAIAADFGLDEITAQEQ